jgi:hypothetical protein
MPGAIYRPFPQPTTVHLLKMASRKVYTFQDVALILVVVMANFTDIQLPSVLESPKLGELDFDAQFDLFQH